MYWPRNKSKLDKVKKGLHQCLMSTVTDEYEMQCADCPYFDPESTVEECKHELLEYSMAVLNK